MQNRAYVKVRSSQHAKRGRRSGFTGPDTYVAVQVVPDGELALHCLDDRVARKKGILIVRFGAGCRLHDDPRSALGLALAEARAYAADVNAGEAVP